jgi:hypothetical protein
MMKYYPEPIRRYVARAFICFAACGGYGAAAGVIFGALFGPSFGVGGALFGCGAGGVAGLVAAAINRPWGWIVAGALGGLAPAWFFGLFLALTERAHLTLLALVPSVLGALLGWLAARSIQSRPVGLPGMQFIAGVLRSIDEQPTVRSTSPSEMTPAIAPAAFGNEVSPKDPPP